MSLPDPSTVREMTTRASREAELYRHAWERDGFRQVTETDFENARARLRELATRLSDLESVSLRGRAAQMAFHNARVCASRLLGLGSVDWFPASLLIAMPAFPLAAVFLLALGAGLWWIVAGSAYVFFSVAAVAGYFLCTLDRSEFGEDPNALALWFRRRKAEIAEFKEAQDAARRGIERLELLYETDRRYHAAMAELARLNGLMADRRYQLGHMDWRSLRGVPFEDFLADVFRTLGYDVQTTKTSGDQGIDLILTGGGERIAVQAKGYEGNVGNAAVQEAHTGKDYYDCNRCVAVTNSGFTQPARELARKVKCALIDGGWHPGPRRGAQPRPTPDSGRSPHTQRY